MSPDNAAALTIVDNSSAPADEFARMSDRELLEYNARTLAQILAIADAVKDQVQPVMDGMAKNPMLKMLFR